MIFGLVYAFILGLTVAQPWWSLLVFIVVSPWNILGEWTGTDPRLGWSILIALRAGFVFSDSPRRAVSAVMVCATAGFVLLAYIRLHFGTGDLPPEELAGAYRTLLYFVAGICAFYAMMKLADSPERIKTLSGAAALGLLLAGTYGLLEAATQYGGSVASGRINGTLGNANFYAAYLATGATVTIVALRLRIGHRIWLIPVIVAILACFLTFSRMGILACCLGAGVALQIRRSGRFIDWKLVASGLAVVALAAAFSASYFEDTRRGVTLSKDPSAEQWGAFGQAVNDWSRVQAVQFALEEWTEHPGFGMGLATLAARNYMTNGIYVTTHNTYVQVLAGTGLVGMALFVLIVASVVSRVPTTARRYMVPAMGGLGLCGLFADFIGSIEMFVLLAVLITMLQQVPDASPAGVGPQDEVEVDRRTYTTAPAIGI